MSAYKIQRIHDLWYVHQGGTQVLRDVSIHPVTNGWVVTVGCQTLAYTSIAELLNDLQAYLLDPVEAEKRIMGRSVNAKYLGPNSIGALSGALQSQQVVAYSADTQSEVAGPSSTYAGIPRR